MGTIPVANPAPVQRPHISRRGLLVLALPLAVIAFIVIGVAFAWPAGPKVEPARWVDAGSFDALTADQPIRFPEGRSWLVKQESGEILALFHVDPHLGCLVPWRPDFEYLGRKGWFRDPCHSETYDLDGHCVFGPCVRGLDRFEVRVSDGQVEVNTAKVIPGPPLGPDYQAPPPRR
ncbi:MAG TPA: Rieske (2Fe-2S) protein [Dehalococcoidia bacterium]|nr:Rieske (2Fe-2S) protein [Dehalococcoidia bacterium]